MAMNNDTVPHGMHEMIQTGALDEVVHLWTKVIGKKNGPLAQGPR
jgi:hypothetical protein